MGPEYFSYLVHDPFVEAAHLYSADQGMVLTNGVLKDYFDTTVQLAPWPSKISLHVLDLLDIFPEVRDAHDIPFPWTHDDLVKKADNIGTIQRAQQKVSEQISEGNNIAYWTGGLEFTQNHYEVTKFLLKRNFFIILGIEPQIYPVQKNKNRTALTNHMVPATLWSKMLDGHGFVFQIPRPLPENDKEQEKFYAGLYHQITNGKAAIVISEADPNKETKRSRGPTVEVPLFPYPSTTDLWNSYVEEPNCFIGYTLRIST